MPVDLLIFKIAFSHPDHTDILDSGARGEGGGLFSVSLGGMDCSISNALAQTSGRTSEAGYQNAQRRTGVDYI